jgi:hypothetical protein
LEVHLSWLLLLVFLGPVLVFARIVVAWVRIRARNREVLTYWSGRRKSPTDAASGPAQPGVAPPPGTPGTPSLPTAPRSPFEAQAPPEGRAHAPRPPSAQPLSLPRVPATGNGPSPLSAGGWSGFGGPAIVHVASQVRQRAQSIAVVARTSCPAHVIAGREFPVGIVVDRPTRDEAAQLLHTLTRHVIAPGFTLGVEQSWRAHINVSALSALLPPGDQVRLTAEHGTAPTETRDVHILLLADGHPVAIDSRSVTVHEDPTASGAARPAEVKALPYRAPTTEAADLTVYILQVMTLGSLHWAAIPATTSLCRSSSCRRTSPSRCRTIPRPPSETSRTHSSASSLSESTPPRGECVRPRAPRACSAHHTLIGLGDEIATCMPPGHLAGLSDIAAARAPPAADRPDHLGRAACAVRLAQMPTPFAPTHPAAGGAGGGRPVDALAGRASAAAAAQHVEVRSMATVSRRLRGDARLAAAAACS